MSELTFEDPCQAVHARIRAGECLESCRAHLAACEPCGDLALIGGQLVGFASAPGAGAPESDSHEVDLEAHFSALSLELEGERGLLARLRACSTASRRGLLFLATGLILSVAWGLAPWGQLPPARAGLTLGVLVVLLGAGLWQSLRPLHRPPLATWKWLALVAVAVAFPLALAALPAAVPSGDGVTHGGGGLCFGFGCLLGLPILALGLLVDRAPGGAVLGSGALLCLAASGMLGGVTLDARCGAPGLGHRLLGHGALAATWIGLGLALLALRARARR